MNENVWFPITISLKFVPKGLIKNIPALVQIMVWRRPGDKLLSEPMMARLPTHICVARSQWVNPQHAEETLSISVHLVTFRAYQSRFNSPDKCGPESAEPNQQNTVGITIRWYLGQHIHSTTLLLIAYQSIIRSLSMKWNKIRVHYLILTIKLAMHGMESFIQNNYYDAKAQTLRR